MTRQEIDAFIEIMKTAVNEEWTPEAVAEKYGDCRTLKEAMEKRMNALQSAIAYLEDMVTNDLKELDQNQP